VFDIDDLTSGDISVDDVSIHYYRTGGDKPALVLLHGITDSGRCWPGLVRHLGDDYDMVMVDARGHGLSDAPQSGYSLQEHAADVIGVINALGLHRPVLVGHSMGAMTAMVVATTSPGLVRGLILEDPPLSTQQQFSPVEAKSWMEEARIRITKEQEQTLSALVADRRIQSPFWSEDELMPWALAKHQVSPNVAGISVSLQIPWRSAFSQIVCPILLLTADPDAGARITPELAGKADSLWSDGRVVRIKDAGHNIRRDQFEKYITSLTVFLAEIHGGLSS
jgi:pimeloyl-ACP methyl ester carboxylesterase